MNKNIIYFSATLLFIVVISLLVINSKPQNKEIPLEMVKKADYILSENADSRYIPYSKTLFESAPTKRRVLFFYATWCPTCKIANDDFSNNLDKIPADTIVFRVNYNDPDTDSEEKDLARKYEITYQHTFVQVDSQGNVIAKWNGGQTDDLLTKLK